MPVVRNRNVAGLVRRYDDFIKEIVESDSANQQSTSAADLERWNSYLSAIDRYVAYVVSEPEVDVPESASLDIQVKDSPVIPDMENNSVYDLAWMMYDARHEVVNNQSRTAYNFTKADTKRVTDITEKCRRFLLDYVEQTQPLDMPESIPEFALTGPGRTGQ